jgi:NAD(P)-dependent dehydrogenase (short-subunit alcohol dehydrogenase family)
MQTIVVTGSTRGIGRGLATEFLKRGHRVVVTGRSASSVDPAVAALSEYGEVFGQPCNVSDFAACQSLWNAAVEKFGRVDIWINNAALATDYGLFADNDGAQIAAAVDTNVTGTMFGTQVALQGMLAQGAGKIYTFEGFGSNGMKTPGLAVYGTTKYAIRYFTEALAKEYEDSPVLISSLSPGMVPTELLVYSSRSEDPKQWEKSKRVMNILGDKVETVTPWLVEQALTNEKNGARIEWLTKGKAMRRFLLPGYKNRHIVEDFEKEYEVKS